MNHYILGIQCFANADSGACIIKFSKKTKPEFIAISEERLLRKKYPYTFPVHSILYCLNFLCDFYIYSKFLYLKLFIELLFK